MDARFIAGIGVIEFTNVDFSVTENNSRVSDGMFTKYTFPFSFEIDDNFLRDFGDYLNPAASTPVRVLEGYFIFEGNSHPATLNIQNIEGRRITTQIDFGFEELPNFSKKLAELPLERFEVNDIYNFAADRIKSVYPFTNFNFPRIYNQKYTGDSELWKTFDGYLNDMKPDGSGMRRNYIDNEGNIFNVNIIHPCPHILYLLKTGFADAGYQLGGDIVTDPVLSNKWVYSGTDAFTVKQQRRYGFNFRSSDFDSSSSSAIIRYAFYSKEVELDNAGVYLISGKIDYRKYKLHECEYRLELNGSTIWRKTDAGYSKRSTKIEIINLNVKFTAPANSTLKLYVKTMLVGESHAYQLAELLITSEVLDSTEDPEENTNVVTNLNEINLSKAVPDITFGELVKVVKNWFNYDIDLVGKTVEMNRLGTASVDEMEIIDFTRFKSDTPKRSLIEDRSFYLKFPELDEYKKDNMYYDIFGESLNGDESKANSTIEIQGYHLPVHRPKRYGYLTAFVCKDAQDLLQLVDFSGTSTGNNNASYDSRCDFPNLFENNWRKWLRQRVQGQEYQWEFLCHSTDIASISIKDYLFAYNQIHIIKSWTKNKIGTNVYQVEMETETVV